MASVTVPLIAPEVHSDKAKEVVQILEETDEVKNHENISFELERCLLDKAQWITAREDFIRKLFIHEVLGNTSLSDFKDKYPTTSKQLEAAIDFLAKKWKIKELMCALEATKNEQVIALILEWAKKLSQQIQKIKEEQVNSHNVQDGNNNGNHNCTLDQIEMREMVRPGRRSESSIPPRANPVEHVPSRDSGFGDTLLTTNSPLHRQSPAQEIISATLQRIRGPRSENLKKALSESDLSELCKLHWPKPLAVLDEAEGEKLLPRPVEQPQSVQLPEDVRDAVGRQPPPEDSQISGRKGEQELRFGDVVHKTTSNKLKLAKEIKSCIQQRKTLVEIQLECDRVKRVNKFVQVIDKCFRHRGPTEFLLLRVVRLDIKTDKHDQLKYPSRELIESLFFFLPSFSSKNLVEVDLNEIFIKINGRVYLNMVKTEESCHLVLHKLNIFSPQQFLTDPKLNLVSLSCMFLSVPLKLLQNCVSLKELNLNNCYFPQEDPPSSSKGRGTEEHLKFVAKEMTGTLAKLPNLKELVLDMGKYKGHFDLSVLAQLSGLEKLIIGHCVLDITLPSDMELIRNFNGNVILYNCEFSAPPEFIGTYEPGSTIIYFEKGKEPRLVRTTYNISNIRDPQKRAKMNVEDEKKWFSLFQAKKFVDFGNSPFRLQV